MKKNALQLMQDLRDYFKQEYGIKVDVKVSVYDTQNKGLTGEKALELAKKLQPELKCGFEPYEHTGTYWVKLTDINNIVCSPLEMTIFAATPVPGSEPADYPQTC